MQSTRTARYIDVFRSPGALSTFGTALIGRGAYALVFLPLLYAVTGATHSVGLAGVAVGLCGAGAGFLGPVRAWFVDRFGARRVLTALVVVFGGTLAAIGLSAVHGADGASLVVLAAVAGAFAPPLGPTMRVAWGRIAPTGDLLKKALSLDAVVEELLYLSGPAVMGIVLVFVAPGCALLVPAGLVLVGGLLFVATGVVGRMEPRPRSARGSRRVRSLAFSPSFVSILIPAAVAGAVSGSISLSVPVVVSGTGGPAAAGIALGLFAGGSAVGGLIYGALRIPGSPIRQLLVVTSALVAVSSTIALVAGAVAVSVVLAAAGLFFSPVMIVAYLAAHHAGGESRQNAATTWVDTSHNIGAALGSALAGVAIQLAGVPASALGIAVGAVALLGAGAVLSRTGTPTTS